MLRGVWVEPSEILQLTMWDHILKLVHLSGSRGVEAFLVELLRRQQQLQDSQDSIWQRWESEAVQNPILIPR